MQELLKEARIVIQAIETHIDNPYSPEGFYKIFAAGFLPVPYLWGEVEEFKHAKAWKTKPVKGSVKVVDENNNHINAEKLVDKAIGNIPDAEYNLKQRTIKNLKV